MGVSALRWFWKKCSSCGTQRRIRNICTRYRCFFTSHFWWIVSSPTFINERWWILYRCKISTSVSQLCFSGGLSTDGFHSSCNKWGLNRHKIPGDCIKLPCTIEHTQHFGSPLQVFCIKMKKSWQKEYQHSLLGLTTVPAHTLILPSSCWCQSAALRQPDLGTNDHEIKWITIKWQIQIRLIQEVMRWDEKININFIYVCFQ